MYENILEFYFTLNRKLYGEGTSVNRKKGSQNMGIAWKNQVSSRPTVLSGPSSSNPANSWPESWTLIGRRYLDSCLLIS